MIRGAVSAAYEPIVRLAVRGPAEEDREIEAVVDTGYNGYLTLSPELVSALQLPFVTTNPVFLADGSEVTVHVHTVTVLWDGDPREVDAHVTDSIPLVGMRLLDRHNLNIRVETGGSVVIQGIG